MKAEPLNRCQSCKSEEATQHHLVGGVMRCTCAACFKCWNDGRKAIRIKWKQEPDGDKTCKTSDGKVRLCVQTEECDWASIYVGGDHKLDGKTTYFDTEQKAIDFAEELVVKYEKEPT